MRKVQAPRRRGDPNAAAPATVTGEVTHATGCLPGRRVRRQGQSLRSASRETCQQIESFGGRGVPRWHACASLRRIVAGQPLFAFMLEGPDMSKITLLVCTTCRGASPAEDKVPDSGGIRPGAALLKALEETTLPDGIGLRGVECLSACNNGCAIGLTGPGRWSYVYGRLDPALHLPAIIEGAAAYAASADGLVPWRQRPEIFRKQSLARLPPQD